MALEIEFWHWLAVGIILIAAEVFIPGSTLLWFGLGAVVAAVFLLFFPDMTPAWQMLTWLAASSALTLAWLKFFRARTPGGEKGASGGGAVLGESGIVIRVPADNIHGTVRFTSPVLGSEQWPFVCKEEVSVGDTVYITDISEDTLIVEKRGPE